MNEQRKGAWTKVDSTWMGRIRGTVSRKLGTAAKKNKDYKSLRWKRFTHA